ncbi:hypothetical protein ES705_27896 [subsurface metagenome]
MTLSHIYSFAQLWCQDCGEFTWHLSLIDGGFTCLSCRAAGRPGNDALGDLFHAGNALPK